MRVYIVCKKCPDVLLAPMNGTVAVWDQHVREYAVAQGWPVIDWDMHGGKATAAHQCPACAAKGGA